MKYIMSEFTKKELKIVEETFAKRMKDYIFMAAKEKSREAVNTMLGMSFRGEDKIEITYGVTFVFNDLLQIVGRLRR